MHPAQALQEVAGAHPLDHSHDAGAEGGPPTLGGCNLQPGDLLGSGTFSGPSAAEAGALLELSQGGRQPLTLPVADGRTEQRNFLEDGDEVTLRAALEAPGAVRLGLGACTVQVLAPHPVR